MMNNPFDYSDKKLVVITGPTASGKTDLAINVALHFKTEIISADSRQFYTGMNIGTAKPDKRQLSLVPHHFISFLNPDQEYNTGDFEKDVLEKLETLFSKHDVVILCGGSGMYIKAVCEGMDEMPPGDTVVREKLNELYKEKGLPFLQLELEKLDPDYYSIVDIYNPHRLIRALEVIQITGSPYSKLRKATVKKRPFQILKCGILMDRDELYHRINRRVDIMIQTGLEDEARSLLQFRNCNALMTVGYREMFEYLDGAIDLPTAIDKIKQNTRHYAKRQMTWLRKEKDLKWFEPSEITDLIEWIEEDES